MPGQSVQYLSIDTAAEDADNVGADVPTEFLNSLNPSGLPRHDTSLKLGAAVLLLRNLSGVDNNGTRYIITGLRTHSIEVFNLRTGHFRDVFKVDHSLASTAQVQFERFQLPILLAFAETTNKAQGQTFDTVGYDATMDVFSHGQAFVGVSRGSSAAGLKVYGHQYQQVDGTVHNYVRNYVFPEVFPQGFRSRVPAAPLGVSRIGTPLLPIDTLLQVQTLRVYEGSCASITHVCFSFPLPSSSGIIRGYTWTGVGIATNRGA